MRRFATILSLPFFLVGLAQAQAEPLALLAGHTDEVQASSFSKDGSLLASASTDRSVIVWDVQNKKPLVTLNGHQGTVYGVAFSKVTDHLLASGSSRGDIMIWDASNGNLIQTLSKANELPGVLSMEFAPKEDLLAVTFFDGSIRIWNLQTRSVIVKKQAHMGGYALSVHFTSDGTLLATTGGVDGTVKVWNKDLTPVESFGGSTQVTTALWNVAISPDGKTFAAACSDGSVKVWKSGSKNLVGNYQINDFLTLSVVFSPDGSELFAGVAAFNSKVGNNIKVLDSATGALKRELVGHTGRVRNLTLSPDGKLLASSSWDQTVGLWNANP